MAPEISDRIAHELERKSEHVAAALELFGEGATIPFVARYRKERTGGMDEEVLRVVRDRSEELQALDKRRAAILSSLAERELLTDELKAAVEQAPTLAELEDVYLP